MLRARMQRELDTNEELAARLKRPLGAYLRSLYYDTICFEPAYLRSVVAAGSVDASHLVLGSDTPFPLGEPDPVGFVSRTFTEGTAGVADMILQRNAGNLLGIAKPGGAR